jgi:chemotaxis response regulator CheB
MADSARIALLARPGGAREQLRKALTDLGAELVAEGDPSELDPAQVASLKPNIVLVSLEPAVEAALERFDGLLSNDDVEVMYDDAEVTKNLEGWDLNRWARHLAAKLLGRDVLPPAPEATGAGPGAVELDLQPVPGAPPTPAQLMDNEKLETYAAESSDLAEWVPTNPSLTADLPPEPEDAPPRAREADELPEFDLDMSGIESAMLELPDAAPAPTPVQKSAESVEIEFDGDFSLDMGNLEDLIGGEMPATESKPAPAPEPTLADLEISDGPISFSSFGSDDGHEQPAGLDADVAALAAQLEEFEKSDTRETARDPDFSWAPNDDAAKAKEMRATPPRTSKPIPDVAAPPPQSFDLSNLSLLDENSLPVEPIKPQPVAAPTFKSSLSLESLDDTAVAAHQAATAAKSGTTAAAQKAKSAFDTSSLSLESLEPEPPSSVAQDIIEPGALLIVAGMGGPDAVRQMLMNLPGTLRVPVLLYQHLEVGKHERLVDQLAKISKLGVYLAMVGETAQPGKVAVLPAGMAVKAKGDALVFALGSLETLVYTLPAAHSVLAVLSGADVSIVAATHAMVTGGGKAFVQSPDTCFDAAAAQAIASNGAPTMAAAQIAERVRARWPA